MTNHSAPPFFSPPHVVKNKKFFFGKSFRNDRMSNPRNIWFYFFLEYSSDFHSSPLNEMIWNETKWVYFKKTNFIMVFRKSYLKKKPRQQASQQMKRFFLKNLTFIFLQDPLIGKRLQKIMNT